MSSKDIKIKQEKVLKELKEKLKKRPLLSYKDYIKQAIDRGEKEYKNAFKDKFTTVEESKNIEI